MHTRSAAQIVHMFTAASAHRSHVYPPSGHSSLDASGNHTQAHPGSFGLGFDKLYESLFINAVFLLMLYSGIVTAMLTMHSFDRVVRRHEQEAILQQPATWDPIYRAELEASRAVRQDRARRANSTIPPTPTPRRLNWSDEPSVRIRSVTPSVAMPRGRLSPYPRFHSEAHSAHASRTVSVVPTEKSSTTQRGRIVAMDQHSLPSQPHSSSQDAVSPSPSESDFSTSLPSPCASDLHILRRSSSALSDKGVGVQD